MASILMPLLLALSLMASTILAAPSLILNQRTIAISIGKGRADHPKDWVGLYRVDVNPATRVAWKYLSGSQTPPSKAKTSATLYFSLPAGEGASPLFSRKTFWRRRVREESVISFADSTIT